MIVDRKGLGLDKDCGDLRITYLTVTTTSEDGQATRVTNRNYTRSPDQPLLTLTSSKVRLAILCVPLPNLSTWLHRDCGDLWITYLTVLALLDERGHTSHGSNLFMEPRSTIVDFDS